MPRGSGVGGGGGSLENPLVWWPLLVCVLAAAAVLRFRGIAVDSIWLDEAVSWSQARRSLWDVIQPTAADSYPLHNLILHFTIQVFGDAEKALRAPSAACGVLCVAATFWVGAILGGRGVGLLSAILLALSGYHISLSQEALPYAILALTAVLFVGATLRALDSGRVAWGAVAGVAATFLLYAHPYGLLLWISIAVSVAVITLLRSQRGWQVWPWAIGQTFAAVAFSPWALLLILRYHAIAAEGALTTAPGFVLGTIRELSSGWEMALVLVGGVAICASLAFLFRVAGDTNRRPAVGGVLLLLAWLIGPSVIGLIASIFGHPILTTRFLVGSLPALMLLASTGYASLFGRWLPAFICLAVIFAGFGLSAYKGPQAANWRNLVAVYRQRAQPTDCVVFYRGVEALAFQYYWRGPLRCSLKAEVLEPGAWMQLGGWRIWVFLTTTGPRDETRIVRAFSNFGWQHREWRARRLRLIFAEAPHGTRPVQ